MEYSQSHKPEQMHHISYRTLPWVGYWDHTRNRLHHMHLEARGSALSHLDRNRHEPGFLVFFVVLGDRVYSGEYIVIFF